MSTMEDTKEIEAWDAYRQRGGMLLNVHEIRSHRAPEVPNAFRFRRVLLLLTILTVAAAGLNSTVATKQPTAKPALPVPILLVEPQQQPLVELPTPRVDTGSEVDTAGRTTPPRGSRSVDARTPILPPVEKAIAYALAQVGDRYKWGASGPNAFDCSGLVMMAFSQIGISLPHYTGTMVSRGQKVSKSEMKRGDIIFPSSGHVAIYLGNGQQVAASGGKGRVVVQPVYGFYAARRLV